MRNIRPETMVAWSALLVAHRRITDQLDAELRQAVGIRLEDYDVLYQLRRAGQPLRMAQLAERVVLSRPTASRVIDRLVVAQWVRRWHDAGDRRVVLVELTPAGRRQQSRAARIHLDGIARLIELPLADMDLAALVAALEALAGPPT